MSGKSPKHTTTQLSNEPYQQAQQVNNHPSRQITTTKRTTRSLTLNPWDAKIVLRRVMLPKFYDELVL